MNKETPTTRVLRESRELIRAQKYAEACQQLQKLLEEDPKEEDALELLGMTNFFQQKLQPARECFERLTQLNPAHTKAWVNLGAILNRMGEYKKATDVLRRALQRDRKCAEAYYNMGIAHRAMQMNTMAISAYKEAIKLAPNMVDANINLGNIYMDMKNVGLALQCFQSALRHEPGSAKAKRCLETAQSTQKTSRKEASPFGRLVDVADLDRQQQVTESRILDAAIRLAERETIQKHTKIVRSTAREMIATLESTLPHQLHRLKIAILHVEEHLDATDLLQKLETSIEELNRQQDILLLASDQIQECMQTS
ncbi:MAG: tetratricopeptide repeat protein [Planctomycetaceae bacterium]